MMKWPKRALLYSLALLCVGSLATPAHKAAAVTGSDWKAGRIIDDGVFTNANDMSVADIQNFLNSKVPSCDTNGTQPATEYGRSDLTHAQYAAMRGWASPPYVCLRNYYEWPKTAPGAWIPDNSYYHGGGAFAGGVSAAQLIYNAAQQYQINPKVLLVKLHTESAGPLTTDTWPLQTQYTYAMGAHCPDSGPGGSANCDSNYAGFSIQIAESAALLRWYLDSMTQSWWQYKKPYQTNSILWNVSQTGCGASNVYIENKASAALYTYTPYQPNAAALANLYGTGDGCSAYGNRNFWRVFSDWFGSTLTPSYAAEFVSQTASPWLKNDGENTRIQYSFKNVGIKPWYDEVSAWSAAQPPVRLGTDLPLNRPSGFDDAWRFGPTRPADTFAAVYEADGTTLAANQHIVQPGQIARFEFSLRAKTWMTSGAKYEGFRPIVEGWGPMWGGANYYSIVTVVQSNYSYAFKGQSPYPTITQSQTSSVWLQYQNTGNVPWYDEVSAWSAGRLPVRLGTDSPINRTSAFSDAWRFGPTRPADTFAAVYEADGTTLAANQHIVQPGQIARFSFNLRTPANKASGFYPEAFRPVVEGWGPMTGSGTWLGVTVTPSTYSYTFKGQSIYPTIPRGQSTNSWLQYQNTGNVPWYDEVSAWSAGRLPVRLGTDSPINRTSAFSDAWRFGPTRPADTFAAVYEADGTTLAANQHIVQPGQIARFSFNLRTPANKASGFYPEAFRPVVEGWGPMTGSGTWLGVTVP